MMTSKLRRQRRRKFLQRTLNPSKIDKKTHLEEYRSKGYVISKGKQEGKNEKE